MNNLDGVKGLLATGFSLVLIGCGGGTTSTYNDKNKSTDKNTTLNVVDGPVNSADIYVIDGNGNEVYIGDTNTSGQIVIKNSDLKNIEGDVKLKAEGGNDENGVINGAMYSPIMPVNELKKLINEGAILYITPTTTAYEVLQKETNTSLITNFSQQLTDENNDSKKDWKDAVLHPYDASKTGSLDNAINLHVTPSIIAGNEVNSQMVKDALDELATPVLDHIDVIKGENVDSIEKQNDNKYIVWLNNDTVEGTVYITFYGNKGEESFSARGWRDTPDTIIESKKYPGQKVILDWEY